MSRAPSFLLSLPAGAQQSLTGAERSPPGVRQSATAQRAVRVSAGGRVMGGMITASRVFVLPAAYLLFRRRFTRGRDGRTPDLQSRSDSLPP